MQLEQYMGCMHCYCRKFVMKNQRISSIIIISRVRVLGKCTKLAKGFLHQGAHGKYWLNFLIFETDPFVVLFWDALNKLNNLNASVTE